VIAPIPDLWPRFPPSARSGWPDGLSLPRSSRRNAPRGPNSSRSRNLRFAPIPRGLVQSCYPRGRRGGFAAPGAVATGLYCGPRYATIWRAQARTISRRLAALATRPSATAPRRLRAPRGRWRQKVSATQNSKLRTQNFWGLGGRKIRNPKSEIRNPKSIRVTYRGPEALRGSHR